jgi:transcriptional regulator EpsA
MVFLMNRKHNPNPVDLSKVFPLIMQVVGVRWHAELARWLQGDVQQFLPHDILVAAWGDFHVEVIHYDVMSSLAGVASENSSSQVITQRLKSLFDQWVFHDRKPFVVPMDGDDFLLDKARLSGSADRTLPRMRSALIHGISDYRGRHDCLFVLLSTQSQRTRRERIALKLLMPYIDCALRQAELQPSNAAAIELATPLRPGSQVGSDNEDNALNTREVEIMEWVSRGKTNGEIGDLLNVSPFTVKNHMQRIFKKLDVFSRSQAIDAFSSYTVTMGAT